MLPDRTIWRSVTLLQDIISSLSMSGVSLTKTIEGYRMWPRLDKVEWTFELDIIFVQRRISWQISLVPKEMQDSAHHVKGLWRTSREKRWNHVAMCGETAPYLRIPTPINAQNVARASKSIKTGELLNPLPKRMSFDATVQQWASCDIVAGPSVEV